MRQTLIAILILIATLTVAMGGFVMRHNSAADHEDCFVITPGNEKCINIANLFWSALSHINILKNISLSIVGAAMLLFVLIVFLFWFAEPIDPKPNKGIVCKRTTEEKRKVGTEKVWRWLSIHEKRDSQPVLTANM